MHNLYYATAVELGLVGVAVFGVTLVTVAVTILVNACRRPSLELAFLAALVVIFGSRAFIELDFLSPFSLGTLMLPLLWSYATQAPGQARRPVAVRRPAGFHPGPTIGRGVSRAARDSADGMPSRRALLAAAALPALRPGPAAAEPAAIPLQPQWSPAQAPRRRTAPA